MHPYQELGSRAFWGPAVGKRDSLEISQLWKPKFRFRPKYKYVTFGSCFAQHFGNALKDRDLLWHITEPAPPGLGQKNAKKYNYGVFSARTGNIYTTGLFLQWVRWGLGLEQPPLEIWTNEAGRFFDPFRPNIEPDGFSSKEELLHSREMAIESFGRAITEANVFVFTLGLTESWKNLAEGYEYPMCPGTVAGEFDEKLHGFENQRFGDVHSNLKQALKLIKQTNKNINILLTVSPVPLTATMSGNHVLVATVHSKAILRAVAGQLSEDMKFVDYFPSYEIISSTPFMGRFYLENKRSVAQEGVNHVMNTFFSSIQGHLGREDVTVDIQHPDKASYESQGDSGKESDFDVVCEEEILAAFGEKKND